MEAGAQSALSGGSAHLPALDVVRPVTDHHGRRFFFWNPESRRVAVLVFDGAGRGVGHALVRIFVFFKFRFYLFKLHSAKIGCLPIVDRFIERMGLREKLKIALGNGDYADALLS